MRAVIVLIVAAVALVGGGVLLGNYFETPEEASLRQSPEAVPVTDALRSEVLERTLSFRGGLGPAVTGPPRFAVVLEGKIITAIKVEAGQVLASGQVLMEVEGRPVTVLTGAFPAWRDLTWPMPAGPDIAQLQSALAELGFYRDEVNGRYEAGTLLAVLELYKAIGYEPPSRSSVRHEEFVFVPSDLRTVQQLEIKVGDILQADAITLASVTRRIEADLTVDQRQVIKPGLTIRAIGSSGARWSGTIDRVVDIERDANATGPTFAILTRESIPASITGEQGFEVVIDSTSERVFSASPAAVHIGDDGQAFVVVLDGAKEIVTPVHVGLVTDSRVEISSQDKDALAAGDLLVLNPNR